MLEYVIRRASEQDLPKIQELNQKLFEKEFNDYDGDLKVSWPYDKEGEKYFRDIIASGYVAVAAVENEIVGYLAGSFNSRSYRTVRYAEIDNMFVDQEFRRFGIGTKLIESFLKYCKEQNIEHVRVTAYAANHQAIEFYKNNGFGDFELTLKKGL